MTAIASDPQRNLDFYAGVLGLRLVKLTVNFDDPSSFHLYYGDTSGAPGSILTFFSWPGARRARHGRGVVETTHLRVPRGSLSFWKGRLEQAEVSTEAGEGTLRFADFDGLEFELVEAETPSHITPWTKAVPREHAVTGMAGVSLRVGLAEPTVAVLEDELGFTRDGDGEGFVSPTGDFVRVLVGSKAPAASMGSGGVHHIAFRSQSEAEQRDWLADLRAVGFNASPVMDREYFRSIYFREPNGILFEIATDAPGFAVDEPLESLGQALKLPAQFEARRAEIEARLPRFVCWRSRDERLHPPVPQGNKRTNCAGASWHRRKRSRFGFSHAIAFSRRSCSRASWTSFRTRREPLFQTPKRRRVRSGRFAFANRGARRFRRGFEPELRL